LRSAKNQTGFIAIFALLAILLAGGFVPAASAQQAPNQPGPQWFDTQYSFRENLTLTNPFPTAVSEYPFFAYLTFQPSRLSDAYTELRVVDQSGQELPTVVLDQASSNGSVIWAWLLIPTSIGASASTSLEVYYGNPAATLPSYRDVSASANASAGPVTLGLSPLEPGSPSFQISYEGTYSQTLTSKVTYVTDTQHSYGAEGLASQPPTVASPWRVFSGQNGSVTGAFSSYLAGAFRLSQALVVENGSVMIARLLTTTDSSSVSDLTLTDLVDSSQLSTLGQALTSYDSNSGVLSSSVDGAHLTYASNLDASGFDVGTIAAVKSEVSSNTLAMNAGPMSSAGAALSWDFGGRSKVGAVQLLSGWTFSPSPSGLQMTRPFAPLAGLVKVGTEESQTAQATQTTHAESFWTADVPLSNVSISSSGLTIPFSPTGAQPFAGQLSLGGTVSYTLPSSITQGWKPEVEPVGNATAAATTNFYSVQVAGFVDSVRVIPQDSNAKGDAQLVSPTLSLLGSVSRSVLIRYKATLGGEGDFSQQSLYAALDIGSANGFNQTLVIPAVGSAQNDVCGPLLVTNGAAPGAGEKVTGNLIADGSWRTLEVNLNSIVGSAPLTLRMRFCAATTQPFVGAAELDIAAAGVSVESQASNFLSASIPSGRNALELSFIPGASFEPPSLMLTGNVSIPLAEVSRLNWDGRAAFTGTMGWPTIGKTQNGTSSASSGRVSFLRAEILTPLLSLNPTVIVNGTHVAVTPTGQSINIAPDEIASLEGSPRALNLSLSFPDYYLSTVVTDSNGAPLSGASIAVSGQGAVLTNVTTTNAEGTAMLPLMNGTYDLTVSLGGSNVGTATVQLDSNQSLKIPTQVLLTTLRVKDILGSPIQGATVSVAHDSEDLNLTTDGKGSVSFQTVANTAYAVSVSVGGEVYYSGTVTASIYGAVIHLSTSYLSESLKVAIVSGLVLVLAAVASGFYLLRERQARRMV
jgi:hypothetical protein